MVAQTWKDILSGENIRQNLSSLRKEIKENNSRAAVRACVSKDENYLIGLLKNEDAKTRKNAALLMGDLGDKIYLPYILSAYENESQLFIKSSYLSAVKEFDYRPYMDVLKKHLEVLLKTDTTDEDRKHIDEEIRELSSLIVAVEGIKKHKFTGYDKACETVLLTNRNYPELTLKKLKELSPNTDAKVFNAGLIAKTDNLAWIHELRTYTELLFVIKGMKTCPMHVESAAEILAGPELLNFLCMMHDTKAPFYFRIEFKSKLELDKKSIFTKKLSSRIEKLTGRKLINSTSDYEVEIRLIQNKQGECNILIKLHTLPDERFSYRIEVTPTSLRPTNAALAVELCREYMKEDAQILDPFCGVGTMLIERHIAVHANTTYGIDIQADAIEKAKVNTQAAHQIIHYINKDFFDFTHEYMFDEIITDMPFKTGRKTEEEIEEIYRKFFEKVRKVMNPDGTVIMYSHNKKSVIKGIERSRMKLAKEYEISQKEGTFVFVIKL